MEETASGSLEIFHPSYPSRSIQNPCPLFSSNVGTLQPSLGFWTLPLIESQMAGASIDHDRAIRRRAASCSS